MRTLACSMRAGLMHDGGGSRLACVRHGRCAGCGGWAVQLPQPARSNTGHLVSRHKYESTDLWVVRSMGRKRQFIHLDTAVSYLVHLAIPISGHGANQAAAV